MAAPLLLAAFTIPGLVSAGIVSQYYRKSQVSGRYQYLPLDKSLERQISRKLEKTWGHKVILRHRQAENNFKEPSSVYGQPSLHTELRD